ncbi:unnamed protein product [marine sediment metagenome]|uniref:Uncharacterized protein n=1 Tax=marine sediment metagenome TaxID=412755 RepID=X0YJI4_9ZZZZ
MVNISNNIGWLNSHSNSLLMQHLYVEASDLYSSTWLSADGRVNVARRRWIE